MSFSFAVAAAIKLLPRGLSPGHCSQRTHLPAKMIIFDKNHKLTWDGITLIQPVVVVKDVPHTAIDFRLAYGIFRL